MRTLLRLWEKLEACPWNDAVAVEWAWQFGKDVTALREHLKPTDSLAQVYPCRLGDGDGCPRRIREKGRGEYEAICGNKPPRCEPTPLCKRDIVVLKLDREAVLEPYVARACVQEGLTPIVLPWIEGLLPVGLMVRKVGRVLVVVTRGEMARRRGGALELQRLAGADALALLIEGARESLLTDRMVQLGLDDPDHLRLWRALKLLWPESWQSRTQRRDVIFEEAQLEIASAPERHIVRLNGEELKDFHRSDAKLARLLLLAAARQRDRDIEDGGWVRKQQALQLDRHEQEVQLLRAALVAGRPDGFCGMSRAERSALVQACGDRHGQLRLAMHPRAICLDPSLQELRLLTEGPPGSGVPSSQRLHLPSGAADGRSARVYPQEQSRERVLRILAEVRALGVPLPSDLALCDR